MKSLSPALLAGWLALTALGLIPGQTEAATLEKPLARFVGGQSESLRLQGADAQFDVGIPLPARWQPRNLTLNLAYRHSVGLLRDHSQLRVELNGLVIAQFALDPNRPEGQATIRLPLDLLRPGYNALRFAVAQHTVIGQCEDPAAPELWTQIDTRQSTLKLEYERLPIAARLSKIDEIFDRHAWEGATVRVSMPQAQLGESQLRWGALVAQAAALRLEYVPLQIDFRPLSPAKDDKGAKTGRFPLLDHAGLGGDDLALIGTRDQLAPFLGRDWADRVDDAYLAIFPRDDDPGLALLVVSGRDEAEVTRAATALSLLNIPFPDSSEASIGDLIVPAVPPNSGFRRLPDGVGVSFAQLGVETTTLVSPLQPAYLASRIASLASESTGASATRQSLGVEFWTPADPHESGNAEATLGLHFGYGASARRDSVLNVLVNGTFVRGIALDNPQGSTFFNYEIRFPSNLLRAGRNRVDLIAMMAPSETNFCALRQGENLLLTVYRDSSLRLPPTNQFAQLPDLRLLGQSGFPFLRDPQGGELAVQVVGRAPESIAAAWTLLGRLAQIAAVPLHEALIGFAVDARDRELIVVGPWSDLDPTLARAAPLALTDPVQVSYVLLNAITEPPPAEGWLERWLERVESWFEPRSAQVEPIIARASFRDVSLDRYGALMAFESPLRAGRSALLLTAQEPALLLQRASQLVQPDYWYSVRGALTLWDERKESLRWQEAVARYTVGQRSIGGRLARYFDRYPWALLVTASVLFVGLALLLLWMLRRFKRRHHPEIAHEG